MILRKILFTFVLIIVTSLYPLEKIHADALTDAQSQKQSLERELSQLEQEISAKQKELASQKGKSTSISRDIAILTTLVKKSKLNIQAKAIMIKKLGGEINQKNTEIKNLTNKIDQTKESLAQIIRKHRELDDKSMINLILSTNSISDMYGDINAFDYLKSGIKKSVNEVTNLKNETEDNKKILEVKKDQELDAKEVLENEKKQVENNEKEKQVLLSISKSKEAEYQKLLAEKAKRKSDILNALFSLRDAGSIKFRDALLYANNANDKTGVGTAFILAILTQESNLGQNTGSCYVTDMQTGSGVSSKSGKVFSNVMKPSRDVPPFIEITTALGRDPNKTLISCPIPGVAGYGGAMGPAQFIPSTWKGIKSRVASKLGISSPDPWNPRDAIMASATFLEDLGAKDGSYSSQIKAACRYYGTGGSSCSYGKSVMAKMTNIQQKMIDPLQN